MGRNATTLIALAAIVVALFGAWRAYDRWTVGYTVTREDDGSAITKVVAASLSRQDALKVATVTGTVQSVAAASRLGGLLTSDQVVKAPFSVDYTVELARIGAHDLSWDPTTHALTIDVPDVSVERPNVDQAAMTLVSTRGLFVTRAASQEMFRKGAAAATGAAMAEARKPQWLALARENARRDLERLLAAPLAAAGQRVDQVHVVFPFERGGRDVKPWDVSRSVKDVVGKS
ncbi:MAG: DUF4230 domain-containing protein [Janthinobacterium lividum]